MSIAQHPAYLAADQAIAAQIAAWGIQRDSALGRHLRGNGLQVIGSLLSVGVRKDDFSSLRAHAEKPPLNLDFLEPDHFNALTEAYELYSRTKVRSEATTQSAVQASGMANAYEIEVLLSTALNRLGAQAALGHLPSPTVGSGRIAG